MSEVVAIAAVARNGVIGAGNDIPWRIGEDWRRFRALTTGHVLVMGRKTYESIGRALPGRTTIVVTRDRSWRGEGVQVAPSVAAAFAQAATYDPGIIFVAGGGEVYRACWKRVDRLEITEVHWDAAGQVSFPAIDPHVWQEVTRDDRDGFSFVSYQRRRTRAEEGT